LNSESVKILGGSFKIFVFLLGFSSLMLSMILAYSYVLNCEVLKVNWQFSGHRLVVFLVWCLNGSQPSLFSLPANVCNVNIFCMKLVHFSLKDSSDFVLRLDNLTGNVKHILN
jgi:hypothetical protein